MLWWCSHWFQVCRIRAIYYAHCIPSFVLLPPLVPPANYKIEHPLIWTRITVSPKNTITPVSPHDPPSRLPQIFQTRVVLLSHGARFGPTCTHPTRICCNYSSIGLWLTLLTTFSHHPYKTGLPSNTQSSQYISVQICNTNSHWSSLCLLSRSIPCKPRSPKYDLSPTTVVGPRFLLQWLFWCVNLPPSSFKCQVLLTPSQNSLRQSPRWMHRTPQLVITPPSPRHFCSTMARAKLPDPRPVPTRRISRTPAPNLTLLAALLIRPFQAEARAPLLWSQIFQYSIQVHRLLLHHPWPRAHQLLNNVKASSECRRIRGPSATSIPAVPSLASVRSTGQFTPQTYSRLMSIPP